MSTVYGLHEIELRPEVDPAQYEEWFAEEVAGQPLLPGWKAALLRADRGPRRSRYLLVFEIESVEDRDRYFPDGVESEELRQYLGEHPDIAATWQQARSFVATEAATDYVVVAS